MVEPWSINFDELWFNRDRTVIKQWSNTGWTMDEFWMNHVVNHGPIMVEPWLNHGRLTRDWTMVHPIV